MSFLLQPLRRFATNAKPPYIFTQQKKVIGNHFNKQLLANDYLKSKGIPLHTPFSDLDPYTISGLKPLFPNSKLPSFDGNIRKPKISPIK